MSVPLGGLDPVIHAEMRLRILVTLEDLRPGDSISFTRIQELLGASAGNLSTHNRKLEDAGYLTVEKAFEGRTPVTYLQITPKGRVALADYKQALAALLRPPQEKS